MAPRWPTRLRLVEKVPIHVIASGATRREAREQSAAISTLLPADERFCQVSLVAFRNPEQTE
jgi:hypothetical protein